MPVLTSRLCGKPPFGSNKRVLFQRSCFQRRVVSSLRSGARADTRNDWTLHVSGSVLLRGTIGQQHFAAACGDDLKISPAKQIVEPRQLVGLCNEVIALWLKPKFFQPAIVDKHVRHTWRRRSIFQIVELAVQEQRVLIRVENEGRKCVVVVINDEFSRGRRTEGLRERTRREVRIEDDEREPGGVKKQNHHYS